MVFDQQILILFSGGDVKQLDSEAFVQYLLQNLVPNFVLRLMFLY